MSVKTRWALINKTTPWPPRDSPGAVVYHDQIWLLGGWFMTGPERFGRLNDIWKSPDGLAWQQVTSQAPWPARNLAGCVAFKDSLWLMGGYNGTDSLADIWCSQDGTHWHQLTAEAPWGARGAFGCLVYNNRIWVIGGVNWEKEEHYNDVWSSDNGIHWTLVTTNPGWPARAMFPALVFQNRIYILGGGTYHDRAINHNDVWSSDDGIHWHPVTTNAAWPARRFHKALVFDNALWILGGAIAGSTNMNDVWHSHNGEHWHPADYATPWGVRHEFACLAFRKKAWLLGGFSGALAGNTVYNDVWTLEKS